MASVFSPSILDHIRVTNDLENTFFTDFAGTRFPQGSFSVLPSPDVRLTNLQTDEDGFHPGPDGWSALVIAFLFFNSESPVLMELDESKATVMRAIELNLIKLTRNLEILADVVYCLSLVRDFQRLTSDE
jgi:hypothetical protein